MAFRKKRLRAEALNGFCLGALAIFSSVLWVRAPKPEEPILSYLFAKPATSHVFSSDSPPPEENGIDLERSPAAPLDETPPSAPPSSIHNSAEESTPQQASSASSAEELPPPAPDIPLYASSSLVFLQSDGTALAAKESGLPFPTASLTRIAACLAVIEHWDSPNTPVTLDYLDYIGLNANVPLAGFSVGDTLTQKELMQAAFLTNGAEATAALARSVFGTESAMLDAMNEKTAKLNLKNTTFTDIYGSAWSENTSTPEEVGTLLLHGLQNNLFREAFFLKSQTTSPTVQDPEGMTLTRTPSLAAFDSLPIQAGLVDYSMDENCFAAFLLKRDAREILAVVVGASAAQVAQDMHTLLT